MDAADITTATLPEVLVIGGHSVKINVRDRHLCITASGTQQYRIPRQPRSVRRILVLADDGYITLEAQCWMADAGISYSHVDSDDRITAISAVQSQDARLLRAQSRAHPDGDLASVGYAITDYLLAVKAQGQADVLSRYFAADSAAEIIRGYASDPVTNEGLISHTYWSVWSNRVAVPWSPDTLLRVPEHWRVFRQRASLTGTQPPNASATDPISACLNYGYRIAETECHHACLAYGLHPALGISHQDKSARDSMALDLLETIRSVVDSVILSLFAPDGVIPYDAQGRPEYTNRRDFHETREGVCRVMPPLTYRIASHAAELAAAVQPHAYHVAKLLAQAGNGVITVRRPVSPPKRPTGVRKGITRTRLRRGVTAAQAIPDAIWAELLPILPAREPAARGRKPDPVSRDIVVSIAIRYMLRCNWSDVPPGTDKRVVNRWYEHWQQSGAWAKAESILTESGCLSSLTA